MAKKNGQARPKPNGSGRRITPRTPSGKRYF